MAPTQVFAAQHVIASHLCRAEFRHVARDNDSTRFTMRTTLIWFPGGGLKGWRYAATP
jgi:hypothetical protein